MFYPKQDIFSQNWLDIIFERRNKQYGAYALRKDASKAANFALLLASNVFVILLLIPVIKNRLFPDPISPLISPLDDVLVVELTPPPPIDKSFAQLPAGAPPASRTSQVRMPPPKVVKADIAMDEPPSITALKLANPGSNTVEGNPDAAIHIDLPVAFGNGDAGVTESADMGNTTFIHVEIDPEFPGGMEAFYQYVRQNYRYPNGAIEHGIKGQVILQFIVERDGTLTDIKIVRDLKFGTGEEAVRLLQASPKWNPGIQNGRPVRVMYTLPIGLSITR